jgi:hypothetical protein
VVIFLAATRGDMDNAGTFSWINQIPGNNIMLDTFLGGDLIK